MSRLPISLDTLAHALDVKTTDLETVATVELPDPADYDPETATVSPAGRSVLITHFEGGTDPL